MQGNKKILEILSEEKLDAILISSVSNIVYLTGYAGFSYFEREAFLIITRKENYLITDGRYSEAVSSIHGFKLLERSPENSLKNIFEKISKNIKILGIEENDISVSEYKSLKKYFKLKSLKDLRILRAVKTAEEISKIDKACQIGDKAFQFILGKLKTGITEKQIFHELENYVKSKNAEFSFPPIVAFGKNSSMPHYQTNNKKLLTNNIVLLDFGVKFENYCSDMTRTVFFGKADDKFKKIYNTVLDAQQKAIEALSDISIYNTLKSSRIDKLTRDYIVKSGFPTIPHSLGHGVGIEVHEAPALSPKAKDILKPGMVFSIEPGIYIPGYGGVRIEDLVVLEKNKSKLLTKSTRQLIAI